MVFVISVKSASTRARLPPNTAELHIEMAGACSGPYTGHGDEAPGQTAAPKPPPTRSGTAVRPSCPPHSERRSRTGPSGGQRVAPGAQEATRGCAGT